MNHTNMLSIARWLRDERGFSVIPLDHPDDPIADEPDQVGKTPIAKWKAFQATRPTDDNLQSWFGNGKRRNVAIVTGALSGVVAIDGDSAAAVAWMREHLPATEMRTATHDGREHWYYRHPGVPVSNKARIFGNDGLELDVRGDGGYCVAPGSTHRTGAVYSRLGPWPPAKDLPVFDVAWLAPEESRATSEPAATRRRGQAKRADDRAMARARAYLEKVDGAVQGQGGDPHTFVVACRLVRDFGLTPGDARTLLGEWNRTCRPPWSDADLDAKIAGALQYGSGPIGSKLDEDRPGWASAKSAPSADSDTADRHARPILDAGNHDLPAATAGLMKALEAANDPPELFRFGGVPVRLERDEHAAPRVCLLTEDRMRHHAARAAEFVVWRRKTADAEPVASPALPPVPVVRDVLASPDLPFPVLERIVEAPCFGADGRPHLQAGYLAGSRLYLALPAALHVPAVPVRPTPAEIEAARVLLADDLLGDFPFTTPAEPAHAIAVALAPFLRELVDGPTPLFLIEKPAPGTGASLLADVLLLPATGRPVGTMTEGRDEDEWRKRLTAKLASGPAAIVIDNLRKPLEASCLASAITATVWEDRLLGGSTLARLPVRCAWLATGNNPRLSNEMARRAIRIRLDAAVERPWLRTGFRHADLRGWVLAHRAELIHAALVLGQAWIAAGRPLGGRPMGMFESWAGVMGGVLEVAGVPGFLGNLEEFYEASDGEADAWRELVARWWERHDANEVGVGQLWALVNPSDAVTAPIDLALGDGSERSQRTRFGALLRGMRDRVIAGCRVEAGVKRQGAQLWKLTRAHG